MRILRVILAGVLAAVAMFAWSAVAHMLLGVGESGIKVSDNDAVVLAAMKSNLPEGGLYFMPGMDMSGKATEAEQNVWMERYKAGPTAFLVYSPTGTDVMSPAQLGSEFGSNVFACLIGAIIISLAAVGFWRGLLISIMIGIAGWASIVISYVIWYRFPHAFAHSELLDQIGGWFCAGLVLAALLKKRA
jgi:hypothetical protein